MFKSEFDPEAINAMVATAQKFGSAMNYLERLRLDAEAELAQVKIAAEQGTPYVQQFCPARAHECYTALAHINLYLALLDA